MAAPATYHLIVGNTYFPHFFGAVLETSATTEQAAILAALRLWRKNELPLTCIEEFLDLTASDFVKECYEAPSGLEDGEEPTLDGSENELCETQEETGDMDLDAPEVNWKLERPWNPQTMAPALKKKIILKIKDLIASKELRAILLRMFEKQTSPVLLIMPGATTHMSELLNILRALTCIRGPDVADS